MVLAKVSISDFDRFWSVFTSEGAKHRRKFGSSGSRVLRNVENPQEVWVLFDWKRENFQRFLSDSQSHEIMGSAGVKGTPEPIFVEEAGQVES